jgi:hypothetical protein
MTVEEFEIVDLGVALDGAYDAFGPSFDNFDCAVVGIGDTGVAALQDALDQIAIQGLNAASVEAAAREASYFQRAAEVPAADLVIGDELLEGKPVNYYIGIRYTDPRETPADDDGEAATGEDGEDGEDGEEGGQS